MQLLSNAAAAVVATAVLGASERGVMVLALTGAAIIANVAVLGTGQSLRAQLPKMTAPVDRNRLIGAFTWTSIGSVVCAASLAGATCLLAAKFFDPAFDHGILPIAAAIFGAAQVLMLQTTEIWFAVGKFRQVGLSTALSAVGGLVGLALACWVARTADVLLLGQALGQLAVRLVVVVRLRVARLLLTSRPHPATMHRLIRNGSPALGMTVGLAVALRAYRFVLGITSGTAAVGIYSLAATLSETVRILPQSMGQLFMHDAAHGAAPRQLLRACLMACAGSAAAAVIVVIVGRLLIVPLFGVEFADAGGLLVPLIVAEVLFAPYAVASRGLLGQGWILNAAVIGGVASIVAIGLYIVGAGLGASLGLAIACIAIYSLLSVSATTMFLWKSCQLGRAELRTKGPNL